jgi:hypothetical protein
VSEKVRCGDRESAREKSNGGVRSLCGPSPERAIITARNKVLDRLSVSMGRIEAREILTSLAGWLDCRILEHVMTYS